MARTPLPLGSLSEQTEFAFWARVDVRSHEECWPWLGYVEPNGYGHTWVPEVKRKVGAHRVAFVLTFGEPPPARPVIDHVCHHWDRDCAGQTCLHRRCCNPWHMAARSQAENIRVSTTHGASVNARKTHCPQGHSYAEHGFRNNRGQRQCRICVNQRRRKK